METGEFMQLSLLPKLRRELVGKRIGHGWGVSIHSIWVLPPWPWTEMQSWRVGQNSTERCSPTIHSSKVLPEGSTTPAATLPQPLMPETSSFLLR